MGRSQKVALWVAAASLRVGRSIANLLAGLPTDRPWVEADIVQAVTALGLDGSNLAAFAAKPEATGHLHAMLAQAQRIDAGPGALFINGKRWLGRVADPGWPLALQAETLLFRSAGSPTGAYELLIRPGKWREDAELDLQDPVELGDLSALPRTGTSGPAMLVLLDFTSPASRAAWHMLKRLSDSGSGARLAVAALPQSGQSGVPATEILQAAADLGLLTKAVEWLLDSPTWHKLESAALHRWAAKMLQVSAADWQQARRKAAPLKAAERVLQLQQAIDWGEEPVIFLSGRLYTGPLDEARLERALRFAAKQASVRPSLGRASVAQEAP